jgi:hypothetical protein
MESGESAVEGKEELPVAKGAETEESEEKP